MSDSGEQYITATKAYANHVTEAQADLYAYICSLLGGSHDANDVLQETNLVLWQKAAQFDASREFRPWAFRFVLLQVMAYRKRQSHDRHMFSQSVLEAISKQTATGGHAAAGRLEALDDCLNRLSRRLQQWVRQRYFDGETVRSLARREGLPEGTVGAALFRARKALAECLQASLKNESSS